MPHSNAPADLFCIACSNLPNTSKTEADTGLTLEQLFVRPSAQEFFREHSRGVKYRRPMVIQLATRYLREPSGQRWPPPAWQAPGDSAVGEGTLGDEHAAWVRRAAQLAAAASSGSESKAQKRLVVVNPLDVERKASNPGLERALEVVAASEKQGASGELAFSELAQRQLVAVRDVHTDEATVAAVRDAFSQAFDCPVTTNLYMNGAFALTNLLLGGQKATAQAHTHQWG